MSETTTTSSLEALKQTITMPKSFITSFDTIEYFYLTDFNALVKAIELGLTPVEYRTLQYVRSCLAHDVEVVDTEACQYLAISLDMFYDVAALLLAKNLLPEPVIFLGGTENV